jgi:hypothetical protein
LVDEPLYPVDAEEAVAQHIADWSTADLLDHEPEQEIVGVRVAELLTGGSAIVGDQLQQVRGL